MDQAEYSVDHLRAILQRTRTVAARDFYQSAYFTTRADDEILTRIHIPVPAHPGHAYEKQKRKIGDYATAAAAVLLSRQGGTCASASIALTNLAPNTTYFFRVGSIDRSNR